MIAGLPADMTAVQSAGHRVVPRISTRKPVGGSWIVLQTINATVTYDAPGTFPGRTLEATVMLETDGITNITETIDDDSLSWLRAPLSTFGSWVKAEQLVYRMDGSAITVPWGIYRVESLTIDEMAATVTFQAADATGQIEDRPFATLNQGTIKAGQSIQAKMNLIVSDVFTGGIPAWWTGNKIDFAGVADKPSGKGGTYQTTRMEALGSLGVKLAPGWRLICPRSGSILKLIHPGDDDNGIAYVQTRRNLVFPEFTDTVDREGLFNEVVLTYQVTQPNGFGFNRTQQRRVVAQYDDAGEELSTVGPFGYSTRETVSVDVPAGTADPDGYVKDLAYDTIGRSFSISRAATVQCGPIYGLEQGDVVYVQVDPSGNRKRGRLVGATIPLHADGGAWSLNVAMTDTLDAAWKPRYYVIVDATQYEANFEWQDFRPATKIDLDNGTGAGVGKAKVKRAWVGWSVDNDKKLVGGTGLTATSDGGQVVFRTTDRVWSESASEHRYQAKASITAPNHSFRARIGLDTNTQGIIWGAWATFAVHKTGTISVDTVRLVNPAAVTFGIRIETDSMSNNEEVRLNSASVDRAVRNKT